MTGGARGYCNPASRGYVPQGPAYYGAGRGGIPWGGGMGRAWGGGRGGWGRGIGFNRGFGRGMGRGAGWAYGPPAGYAPYGGAPTADEERRYLSDQLAALEEEVGDIKAR
ncbi:MAG TPA: DUF5320 family protein, partial [bacterium]|nr:DUF5320 family protein [bacterium]